jgi:hypothetical protein
LLHPWCMVQDNWVVCRLVLLLRDAFQKKEDR